MNSSTQAQPTLLGEHTWSETTKIDVVEPFWPESANSIQKQIEQESSVAKNESNSLERVSVHPRLLNQSEYASFQLNCIYIGPNFESIKLVWLKNGKLLQIDDDMKQIQLSSSAQHPRRFFTLNYKQNFTSIGVLKFSHGLTKDTGVYKCVALHENDIMRMSLNDTSYLIVNKSELNH